MPQEIPDAVNLITRVDPRLSHAIARELHRLIIVAGGGPAYSALAGGAYVSERYVLEATVRAVAVMIIHEATHARLWRMGFRYHPRVRARIERICVRRELAFARKLEDADELVRSLEEKLSRRWWADR